MGLPQIIIGSGPAGVSCAVALLDKGQTVWMLDGGSELEEEKAEKLVKLSQLDPSEWAGNESRWMREGTKAAVKGLLKLSYGSEFPYRKMPGAPKIESDGVYVQYSMGKGGLSAAWGTAVMPYRQSDIEDWPLTVKDLEPHYRAVLDFMPVAQGIDGLDEEFPTFKVTRPMPLGPQGRQLMHQLSANDEKLSSVGVKFGRSRLAINSDESQAADGRGVAAPPCAECALCMYGCPAGLMYSSAQTVDALRKRPNFRYMPGYVVQRVNEQGDQVVVECVRPDGSRETLYGSRAFLGAGVLATTVITLRSMDAYEQPVAFQDSHYWMMPMLRLRGAPGFERANLQTMSQVFLELMDPSLSRYTTHLQVYTYSDLFEQPIRQMLGKAAALFPWHAFLSRLTLVQAFMHSKDSPGFVGILRKENGDDRFQVNASHRPETDLLVKQTMKKLWAISGLTGMIPVPAMMQRGEPGRGFHTGSTFPMATQPTRFESDLLGRPGGMQRMHLIDSSCLPSIAGTTITYTVMANAHRIGTLANG